MKMQRSLIIRTLLIPTSLLMLSSSVAMAIEPTSLPPTGPVGMERCCDDERNTQNKFNKYSTKKSSSKSLKSATPKRNTFGSVNKKVKQTNPRGIANDDGAARFGSKQSNPLAIRSDTGSARVRQGSKTNPRAIIADDGAARFGEAKSTGRLTNGTKAKVDPRLGVILRPKDDMDRGVNLDPRASRSDTGQARFGSANPNLSGGVTDNGATQFGQGTFNSSGVVSDGAAARAMMISSRGLSSL